MKKRKKKGHQKGSKNRGSLSFRPTENLKDKEQKYGEKKNQ